MNWLRGDSSDNPSDSSADPAASSTPTADELRRRRLAKLEQAHQAEKERRKQLEERRRKWEEEKAKKEQEEAEKMVIEKKKEPVEKKKPQEEQDVVAVAPRKKAKAQAPPDVGVLKSRTIEECLGIAWTDRDVGGVWQKTYKQELVDALKGEDNKSVLLDVDSHVDDILLREIEQSVESGLHQMLTTYERCYRQIRDSSTRKWSVSEELNQKLRDAISGTAKEIRDRVFVYFVSIMTGAFMHDVEREPEVVFLEALYQSRVPSGFISALISYAKQVPEMDIADVLEIFGSVLTKLRERVEIDREMDLARSSFVKPLDVLMSLVQTKDICTHLAQMKTFSYGDEGQQRNVTSFLKHTYLSPFFMISALPGLPLHQPTRFENPIIAASMFPNPSMLSPDSVSGTVFSLRSSLMVARTKLFQICLLLCKAGKEPREKMLAWFGDVLNLNIKRSGMRFSPEFSCGDGFMMNVMDVLLRLAGPIVNGGWKILQKVDPTFPQSRHRLDYNDETRLAADTNMLRRWWVDQRNENAQESLTRQLEVAAREVGLSSASNTPGASTDGMAGIDQGGSKQQEVTKDFNFVTECFWLALRGIQLGFMAVQNTYVENLNKPIHRMKDAIADMEAAQEMGSLNPMEAMNLKMLKRQFDKLLSIRFCYDVYMQDEEMLESLMRFASAVAEWLIKKLLTNDSRSSILPLPVPADPTFASLPEHSVETITKVYLWAMKVRPGSVENNLGILEDVVSFCIIGAASPLHVKNPYLRAKLVELLWTMFPRRNNGIEAEEGAEPEYIAMESLFTGHELSRKFLPGALFRLYVDVEHTGSHTQFYDKFSIRYRIGSIIESLWYMPGYRKSVQDEARDENRFLRFVNMLLNDANHLVDSVLDNLEEMHAIEMMMKNKTAEWEGLSDEEKREKAAHLKQLENQVSGYNQLGNNNIKLLWLITEDSAVRRVFVRDEMVSRLAEMLNYLLERLCGQRCQNLIVREPEKVLWKPRVLLRRLMQTYVHFKDETSFAKAVGLDGRSYKKELIPKAVAIAKKKHLLGHGDLESVMKIAQAADKAVEEEKEEEADLGDIPEEFLDPIMSSLMRNPVRLPTSGNVMDRAVISRILLSDKVDPFNRKLLTEDMLEDEVELRERVEAFIAERKRAKNE